MPGKMARSDPRPSVQVTRGAGSGQHLASVLQEGRGNANIDAGLGVIWRISVYSVLAEAGLPVICVETRHMRAMLKAQINKTDRNDARGIAQMMRAGLYRPV